MIVLKSGLGAKLVLIALGLGLGVGGVAAGAQIHSVHQPISPNRSLFVGHITAVAGDSITVRTQSGATLSFRVLPRTIVRHAGKRIPATDLHVGDTVLVHTARLRDGVVYAVSVGQIKRSLTSQGP